MPSHLAYSAKISYQQPIHYTPHFPLNEVENAKQTTFRLFPRPQQPNVLYQTQSSPQVIPQPQIYNVEPRYTIGLQQPLTYIQQGLNQQPQILPGVIYAQQNENPPSLPPTLREFKNSPPPNIVQQAVTQPLDPVQVHILLNCLFIVVFFRMFMLSKGYEFTLL